jgi:hypothetical protein
MAKIPTPRELAGNLRAQANTENGFVKYSTAHQAATALDRLLDWVESEGERVNICTYNVTGNVCAYCQCGKKPKKDHP